MALDVQIIEVTVPNGTGDQVISHSCRNLKAFIFFGGLSTGSAVDTDRFLGIADSNVGYCVNSWLDDATALPVGAASRWANQDAAVYCRRGSVLMDADVTAIANNTFTLTWNTVDASAQGKTFKAVLIGDIDAKVDYLALNTSVGDQAETGVGFQGDFSFFLMGASTTWSAGVGSYRFGFGWALDASSRGAIAYFGNTNVDPMDAKSRLYTNRVRIYGTTSIVDEVDFKAWGADGFTLDVIDAPASAYFAPYLILNTGGNASIGSFDQATSAGDQTVASSLGFRPVSSFFTGRQETSAASNPSDHDRFFIGAGRNASQQACVWTGASDNVSTSVADQRISSTRCIEQYTEGTPTELADASYPDQAVDSVKVNWDTVDATARQILYAILGKPSPTSGVHFQRGGWG
jgi:hypothetical protein